MPATAPRPSAIAATLRWLLALPVTFGILGLATVAYFVRPVWSQRLHRAWGHTVLRIFGIRLEVEDRTGGLDRPPYLFVLMNQTSLLDALAVPLAWPVPARVFVNAAFALIPIVGWASFVCGGIVVVPFWRAQRDRAKERANRALRRGVNLGISIEGRRSRDGRMAPFKKGPVVMAMTTGARIVPIYSLGAWELWPYGEWRVRPGRLRIVLDPPLALDARAVDERDLVVGELEAAARRRLGRLGAVG